MVDGLWPGAAPGEGGRTVAWLARHVEQALAGEELSLSQYRLLALVAAGTEASSALAQHLSVRPPSVTAVVDGLCARGLLQRVPVLEDRRRCALALTTDGRRVLAGADRALDAALGDLAGALGARDAVRATAGLAAWSRARRTARGTRAGLRGGPPPARTGVS